ncbi:DNA polymerase IV [Thiohalophilus sp.]|uniref:DNA polymerase Y family protein n=1 Tax=Thiohalophilus sp. TaxID=3028392 RepID=UPI003975CFFF
MPDRSSSPSATAPAFKTWPRAILLMDMNAFFASVEQRDRPELRHRPVAITNGQQGTCIITCSYEARRQGVHTGMRLKEARQLCADLIQVPARPQRYAAVSTTIMAALHENVSPDMEIFSVDEAFLDISRCQNLLGHPADIAQHAKQVVFEASSLRCSVGVSGDKTTAKYAAKLNKPDGLTVIAPDEARQTLADVPVTELCGISRGIGEFLAARGVHVCSDMARLPIGVLAQRFGNPGRRIWYMAQGEDPDPVHVNVAPPKTIGHGKVVPPDTRQREILLTFLLHMSEKVGERLRRHNMQAREFFIGVRCRQGWLGERCQARLPTDDGRIIYQLCQQVLRHVWQGEGIHQVQVTALDPHSGDQQLQLFEPTPVQQRASNEVMDAINQRYGEFTLAPARLLGRSEMPNVISPAWRPFGHRKTI